jgi:formylmethanofuran dehydrogenase subunit E
MGSEFPWWMNVLAAPVVLIMKVKELLTFPKVKCPKCGKLTSKFVVNNPDGKYFCRRSIHSFDL